MPTFISDGFTLDGYVIDPTAKDDQSALFDPFSFVYRVATRMEVVRHDAETEKLSRKIDDPDAAVKFERASCEFVARHIVSWEIKDKDGNDVPVNQDSVSRLQPYLFGRIYTIIRNTAVSDPKPPKNDPPTSDEDQLKN